MSALQLSKGQGQHFTGLRTYQDTVFKTLRKNFSHGRIIFRSLNVIKEKHTNKQSSIACT